MTDSDKPSGMGILSGLPDHDQVPKPNLPKTDTNLVMLRAWQTARLQRTYADFLTSKRYGPACSFFLSHVYGAQEYQQRNQDIEYMYTLMRKFIPDVLLILVRNAIELNEMTEQLDHKLLSVMMEQLGLENEIDEKMYIEGYLQCNNYSDRKRQIDLLIEIGHQVDLSTRLPPIGLALRLARGPAKRAGWIELQDFLERGYRSFKQMRGADKFLDAIRKREMQILDRIYDNLPNPFTI